MTKPADFDLRDFMPYLLNQAADVASRKFETTYKTKYGMLRTEWRIIFHLGRYGTMTAKDICDRARVHKTKVSRAVRALEDKRYVTRNEVPNDRRHEALALTRSGLCVYHDLLYEAKHFDAHMMADFTDEEKKQMRQLLIRIAGL